MSGRTGLVVSFLNGQFVHVPLSEITGGEKRLDLAGELWRAVLSTTGQASRFR
jgi:6-phosphofructokinase 1